MSRTSAFKGSWEENKRPYIVLAPDAYVAIQGQTSVITCGECNRKVDVNKYLTGISTEATVDSPPGSATVNLSIPDTDVNDFYVEGNFVIIPMMEVEIFAKGYYTVGGVPQYYRIFWGMVISISKSWSNGTTTFSLSCKDILHWWEKTNTIMNPAFVGSEGASCGYQLFGNQFAGMNPYTVIIALAKEAMGDFSITDGSFMSFKPEAGPEKQVVGQYAFDIMAYWQLKFGNMWNSLVLYGTSGMAYTFEGAGGDVSPMRFASSIFKHEADVLAENAATANFKVQPFEITPFKVDYTRVGDVQFFQNDTQSKLSIALTARDQCAYEFYCDTTGDIIFKPPFYNLNVIPNKPVSWINDFEIIDDNISDSEQEVVTHMTSSGNAFGGTADYGLTDEITVPRTGVMDWHLLKRYGWRRQDFQCEWAGNPKKLFWFLIDYMDRINAKRHSGTVTIPMRPEIRMGFPVWIPFYDSFYYVNGVSHSYSPGGQATTTLTLSAKRSKFVAPKNLGRIVRVPSKPDDKPSANAQSNQKNPNQAPPADKNQRADTETDKGVTRKKINTYKVTFDGEIGQTAGIGSENSQNSNDPLIIRDPNTGKILGYPNVVMVYRTTYADQSLNKTASEQGKNAVHNKNPKAPLQYKWADCVRQVYMQLKNDNKASVASRIRLNRYESGMTNAGLYDYAEDVSGDFKEMVLIPVSSIIWGAGSDDPTKRSGAAIGTDPSKNVGKSKGAAPGKAKSSPVSSKEERDNEEELAKRNQILQDKIDQLTKQLSGDKNQKAKAGKKADTGLTGQSTAKSEELRKAKVKLQAGISAHNKDKNKPPPGSPPVLTDEDKKNKATVDTLQTELQAINDQISDVKGQITEAKRTKGDFRLAKELNVSVRPVSDEFGFEVIGHNRYGRGVFIDRGQLRLKFKTSDETPPNELQIQFSATGNMLTETPSIKNTLNIDNAPEAFEKMKPEDWTTGASSHDQNEVTLTSVRTFSSAINHQIEANAQIGAVFIEADATRRSKTVWELQPTVSTGLDDVGFPQCSCQLSKFQWYSLLPKAVLQEILGTGTKYTNMAIYVRSGFTYVDAITGKDTPNATTTENRVSLESTLSMGKEVVEVTNKNKFIAIYRRVDDNGNVIDTIRKEVDSVEAAPLQIENPLPTTASMLVSTDQSASQSGGALTTTNPDFFSQLNQYLVDRFNESYDYNRQRETQDIGGDLGVEVLQTGAEDYIDPNSVLGPSGGSLFDRASNGDADALQALRSQASWNWSASEKELANFNKAADELKHWSPPQEGSIWTGVQKSIPSSPTKPQVQPYTPAPVKINSKPTVGFYSPPTVPPRVTTHSIGAYAPASPPAPKQKP